MSPCNATGLGPARVGARKTYSQFVRRWLLVRATTILALSISLSTLTSPVAADSPSGMAVSVVRAKRECFSDAVRVTGTVVPKEELQVRPDVEAARVAQVLVKDGESVTAGQELARLSRLQGTNVPASSLVSAPAAGTIGRIMTQVGAVASMSGPPMFLIIVGGEFELLAEIPSTRIGKIAVGQPAKMDIVGVGAFSGQVRAVSPEINIASQTGQARISLGTDTRLKMGAFGRATVEVGTSCGTSVPLSAVLFGPLGPVVQVVRDNRVETRPVPIGLLAGGNVEIKQGLNVGDLVVKRAGTFLRENDRVRPFVEDEASAER
ncbi:MAG: efflux RND transporter periplasmic adaptor subunit [Xanthobacteraceae bacterium]